MPVTLSESPRGVSGVQTLKNLAVFSDMKQLIYELTDFVYKLDSCKINITFNKNQRSSESSVWPSRQ